MRLGFYRLANDSACGYFNYSLQPPSLDLLINRNKTRPFEENLSENIVENIFNKFEYPEQVSWEKEFSYVEKFDSGLNVDEKYECIMNGIERFFLFLNKQKEESNNLEIARMHGKATSLVHEADLVLRQLISNFMKSSTLKDKGSRGGELNKKKSQILKELRNVDGVESLQFYFELNNFLTASETDNFENVLKERLLS